MKGLVLGWLLLPLLSNPIPQLTPSQAQADFDAMRKALEEAHSGLYRYSTKAQMDRAFDRGRSRLEKPLKTTEFMAVVSETLAAIRCGHTGLQPSPQLREAAGAARLFPLQVRIEGARLFITMNQTAGDRSMVPGMEILEINGQKVKDILRRLLAADSGDGDTETVQPARMTRNFHIFYWLLVDPAPDFVVKGRTESGALVTTKLAGVTMNERKANQNPVNAAMQASTSKLEWARENLAIRFLKDPDVAQIRVRSFGGDDYPKWLETTFKTLREKGTKALILDLRGNGGGRDQYGAMLVSYLTDKPFRYFDRIEMKTIKPSAFLEKHSNWKAETDGELRDGTMPNPAGGYLLTAKAHSGLAEQQPSRYPFLGKVFVLIDGGTFSTAADFCAVTHHLKRATFIGEETGGGYYGNTSGRQAMVKLPNSGLNLRLPMHSYWNAVAGSGNPRRGVIPDHAVSTKTASLLRGVDEPLDLAIKLASQ